jgi:transcriptional regulator with PAS, ATPase and Fis domain
MAWLPLVFPQYLRCQRGEDSLNLY